MPAVVEAMASTPNSGAMDGDKKRNKLGYHRTSVACVHCRRRKIRCLVAADDTQGRCENCIRLRKECQFFPVDQQPPIEKKSRPNSRLGSQPGERPVTTPISSSPSNLNPESVDAFYPYSPISLSASSGQDMTGFNTGGFPATPMSGFQPDPTMATGEYPGHPTMETGLPWDEFTTISDPQLMATMAANKGQMMNLTPGVWNPNAMPAASGLPPTSPMAGQAQSMNPSTPTYTMQPDGSVWPVPPQQPSRTMSYPGQADMSSSYPTQFPQQQQIPPDLKRRMTTPAHPTGSNPELQAGPGAVSYPPQAGMGYPQWPMNAMNPGMNVVPYPMYSGEAVQQPPYPNPPMGHPPGRSGP